MTDDIKEGYQKVRKMLRDGMIAKGIDPYGGYGETEPDGWQPIETAPKDGLVVLVYPNYHCAVTCGYYVKGTWRDDLDKNFEIEPTHWMPLPEPPK